MMNISNVDLILGIPLLFFAVVVHECCHGWVAYLNGDDTAKMSGRLTLNPIPHIDMMGTIILPLILIFTHSPVLIGWAKPVPINPYRLNNPVKDMAKVGLAGPGSNFAMAVLSALIIWLFKITGLDPYTEINSLIIKLLYINVQLNLVLGVFNLIPIPPLDGSRIVSAFLPTEIAFKYNQLERYGIFIIFFLLSFGFLNFLWVIVDILQKLLFMGV
ncbi:MAG: site-2 protease family protein [Elusimicrobia bacterium CG06_land_8_20_14_3_00_38_11]|nr:MAG: site-2 protease family protein [Elusimicrobia bacterium CG06_land_8_20_14_3_00_38_11]